MGTMSTAEFRSEQSREIDRLVAFGQGSGEADLYTARREHVRFSVNVPLDARRQMGGNENAWIMAMQDISPGGIGAWSHTPVAPRTILLVRDASTPIRGQWLRCVVRHCTRGLRGFLIGAEFLQEDTTEISETTETSDTSETMEHSPPNSPPPSPRPSPPSVNAYKIRQRVKRR